MIKSSLEFVEKLAEERGAIVSSASCTELEIAFARVENRFLINPGGLGFVLRTNRWLQLAHQSIGTVFNNVGQRRKDKFRPAWEELTRVATESGEKESVTIRLDHLRALIQEYSMVKSAYNAMIRNKGREQDGA